MRKMLVMLDGRVRDKLAAGAFCLALSLSAVAGAQGSGAPAASANSAPAAPANSAPGATEPVIAEFTTGILAGGATNTVTITLPMNRILDQLRAEFTFLSARHDREVFSCDRAVLPAEVREGLTKAERSENVPNGGGTRTVTVVTLSVPAPHCSWPPWQEAKVKLLAKIRPAAGDEASEDVLLNGTVRVSVFWFPLAVTLAIVGAIYPGCAMIAWYINKRRLQRAVASDPVLATTPAGKPPSFWSSLDPVQITANPFGRASLAKLQIFAFSLLVFALMLYYLLRTGILITLSTDILMLLGISAAGATGGKLTYLAKRRLSFPNWAWLRRNNWLPSVQDDVSPRARWAELITDYDGKEFDVYSFQMAIFSLIVAVSLITTNLAGIEAFHIPPELLGLLGLSQGVFIVGRAAGTSPYQELDQTLTDVRKKAGLYLAAKTDKQKDPEAALVAFREAVQQAASMFWDLYGEQIGEDRKPKELSPDALARLTPDAPPAATT
jgi:hypothetical protein